MLYDSHIGIVLGRKADASEDIPVFVCENEKLLAVLDRLLGAAQRLVVEEGYTLQPQALVYVDVHFNYELETTVDVTTANPVSKAPPLFLAPKWDSHIGILLGREPETFADSPVSVLYVIKLDKQDAVSDALVDVATDFTEAGVAVLPVAFVFERSAANEYSLVEATNVSSTVLAAVLTARAEDEAEQRRKQALDPSDPEWSPF